MSLKAVLDEMRKSDFITLTKESNDGNVRALAFRCKIYDEPTRKWQYYDIATTSLTSDSVKKYFQDNRSKFEKEALVSDGKGMLMTVPELNGEITVKELTSVDEIEKLVDKIKTIHEVLRTEEK
jgi:hypothetical protein